MFLSMLTFCLALIVFLGGKDYMLKRMAHADYRNDWLIFWFDPYIAICLGLILCFSGFGIYFMCKETQLK